MHTQRLIAESVLYGEGSGDAGSEGSGDEVGSSDSEEC